jgi:hypothetical protein
MNRLNFIPTLEGSGGYHTSGGGIFGISDSYSCVPLHIDPSTGAIQQEQFNRSNSTGAIQQEQFNRLCHYPLYPWMELPDGRLVAS